MNGGTTLNNPTLSVIITAKDINDYKLQDLLISIKAQEYVNFETIIVTEGNSETAKAIGLRKAKGDIVCILASDNFLNDSHFFLKCLEPFKENRVVGSYPLRYYYKANDDILNRYFALLGVNDPIPLYLGKNDRASYLADTLYGYPIVWTHRPYFIVNLPYVPTLGDNGFFIRKNILLKANIENYFHIDVCQDLFDLGYNTYAVVDTTIWHRTGGNLIKFFKKRLFYADKFVNGRRWHMVNRKDLPRLLLFIISTVTMVYPLCLSIMGYRKIKDRAWFLHLPICLITIGVYGIWVIRKLALLFARLIVPKV